MGKKDDYGRANRTWTSGKYLIMKHFEKNSLNEENNQDTFAKKKNFSEEMTSNERVAPVNPQRRN